MGNIMADSGLLELITLIYPGTTTADHILIGGCFDRAFRAHLLVDVAIYPYFMKHKFTGELGDTRTFIENVV